MSEDIKKMELRITELENQLKNAGAQNANVDPEEMKVFQKVSAQLGVSGCINECQPLRCVACHVCSTCYHCYHCFHCLCNECICGPCILNKPGAFGGTRFGGLG